MGPANWFVRIGAPVPTREPDGMPAAGRPNVNIVNMSPTGPITARSGRGLARLSARTHFGNDHVSEAGQCSMAGEECSAMRSQIGQLVTRSPPYDGE
jgi:hypothetical protein